MPPPVTATATRRQIPYYERDVDFDDLAKRDPDFAAISQNGKRDGFINFKDPKIVQQLTKSILKCDFNLKLDLPDDRLCPPVPVRWNYIRWLQDLLDTTNDDYREIFDPDREVIGLDIGVGASCIYGLLACSTRPQWRMAGTDVDEDSLSCSKRNIEANGLKDRIRLEKMQPEEPLIPLDAMGIEEMDFVMTNPPFYSSQQDFEASYNDSGQPSAPPSAVCTGSINEMICQGGDVGFVMRIFEQSLKLKERVQWYTAMLSKLSSLQQIVAKIKEHKITNYAVMSLHPGSKTKRWAVGWSFQDLRPRNDVSRHGDLVLAVLPPPTAQTVYAPLQTTKSAGKKVDEAMKGLDVRWQWRPLLDAGIMECKGNVWSRAARRKKKFGVQLNEQVNQMDIAKGDVSEEEESVALAVKITCKEEQLDCRWLRGNDYTLFSSFCGMLKQAMGGRGV